jgi:hypothetical protein
LQLALDISNYSGEITDAQVACWRANGYQHLVCGTQRPDLTRRQLLVAVRGGLSVDAYVYLYWADDVPARVRRALDTISGFPVGRLWLDCEDATGGLPAAVIVDKIAAGLAACGERPAGIYTGRWWWVPATGNSSRFAGVPLWHAEYTRSPEVLPDFAAFRAYGGWSRPAMWQFQGTTTVCGVTVDRNMRDYVPPSPAPPGGDYEFRAVDGDARAVEVRRPGGAALEPPLVLRLP